MAIIAVLIVINRHVAVSTSQAPLEGLLSYSSTACETASSIPSWEGACLWTGFKLHLSLPTRSPALQNGPVDGAEPVFPLVLGSLTP